MNHCILMCITRSPAFTPTAARAMESESVPLFTAMQCFAPDIHVLLASINAIDAYQCSWQASPRTFLFAWIQSGTCKLYMLNRSTSQTAYYPPDCMYSWRASASSSPNQGFIWGMNLQTSIQHMWRIAVCTLAWRLLVACPSLAESIEKFASFHHRILPLAATYLNFQSLWLNMISIWKLNVL